MYVLIASLIQLDIFNAIGSNALIKLFRASFVVFELGLCFKIALINLII